LTLKRKKYTGPVPSRMVRSIVIIVALAVLMGVSAKMFMEGLNKKMGINPDGISQSSADVQTDEYLEVPVMPEFDPTQAMETGLSVWVPDWKSTPCSLFVTAESDAVMDSLPESPGSAYRNTELQLLIEMWADYSGFSPVEIERIWVFASGDTCFVDLPRSGDWQGIVKTIEGRFISYTVLFPFVAGEILDGLEEGIPVRGVPSR